MVYFEGYDGDRYCYDPFYGIPIGDYVFWNAEWHLQNIILFYIYNYNYFLRKKKAACCFNHLKKMDHKPMFHKCMHYHQDS